jgi:hypothetical protein
MPINSKEHPHISNNLIQMYKYFIILTSIYKKKVFMKKNLFEVSQEEKNRILEMHIGATLKMYLNEQLDDYLKAKKDWETVASLILKSGGKCYKQLADNINRKEVTTASGLYKYGQTLPTYCTIDENKITGDVSGSNDYKQYSTYTNEITFQQWGYYERVRRGYKAGSGYYVIKKGNIYDSNTNEALIVVSTTAVKQECPAEVSVDIKTFRNWLNNYYPEVAANFKVDKDRTDCTSNVINAANYVGYTNKPMKSLFKDFYDKTVVEPAIRARENMKKDREAAIEDSKSFANPDATQVVGADGKALGHSHQQLIADKGYYDSPGFDWKNWVLTLDGEILTDTIINIISLILEAFPEFLGNFASMYLDVAHAISYWARCAVTNDDDEIIADLIMGVFTFGTAFMPVTGNLENINMQTAVKTAIAQGYGKILDKLIGKNLTGTTKKTVDLLHQIFNKSTKKGLIILLLYKITKALASGTKAQKFSQTMDAWSKAIQEMRAGVFNYKDYVPEFILKALDYVVGIFSDTVSEISQMDIETLDGIVSQGANWNPPLATTTQYIAPPKNM